MSKDQITFKLIKEMFGDLVATSVQGVVVSAAQMMARHMSGEFEGASDQEIGLAYMQAAGLVVVGAAATPLIGYGVGVVAAFGPSIIDAAIDLYFENVKAKILEETDPENRETSVIFTRTPGASPERADSADEDADRFDFSSTAAVEPAVFPQGHGDVTPPAPAWPDEANHMSGMEDYLV